MNTQVICSFDIMQYCSDSFRNMITDIEKHIIFGDELGKLLEITDLGERWVNILKLMELNDLERILLYNILSYDTPLEVLDKDEFMLHYNIGSYEVLNAYVKHNVWSVSHGLDTDTYCFVPFARNSNGDIICYMLFDSDSMRNNCGGDSRHFKAQFLDINQEIVFINGYMFSKDIYEVLSEEYDFSDGIPDPQKLIGIIKEFKKLVLFSSHISENGSIVLDIGVLSEDSNDSSLISCVYSDNMYVSFNRVNDNTLYFNKYYEGRAEFPKSFYNNCETEFDIVRVYVQLKDCTVDELEVFIDSVRSLENKIIFHRGFKIYDSVNALEVYLCELHDISGNYTFMFNTSDGKLFDVIKDKVLLDYEFDRVE